MRTRASTLFLTVPLIFACQAGDEPTAEEISAWEAAHQEQDAGKADELGCSGVLLPDRGGFGKSVALTFDDGPNPSTTPEVLDILKKHNIRAAFFINGMRVTSEAHHRILDRIVDEGHILANHSQHHKQLNTLGSSEVDREIRQTHEIIAQHLDTPAYFRFPFGASNCSTAELARSFGYHITGWNIDSADWCYASSKGGVGVCDPSTFKFVPDSQRDDVVAYTVDQTVAKGGGVVLFHDIHANTVAHLDAVIESLLAKGFVFTNIDDVGVFPLLNGMKDMRGWVGDPCDGEDPTRCRFDANGSPGVCHQFTAGGEAFGFCTLNCEGFCPDRTGASATFCASLDGDVSGSCLLTADSHNANCAKIPGTAAQELPRFIGTSSARPSSAVVCAPAP